MAKITDVKGALQDKPTGNLVPQDRLSTLLGRVDVKKRFEDMLGKKSAGFMSSILSLVNANNALKAADPLTVISSAAIAASLDLPINQNLGFAHIVPYAGRAQFQMGWKGFVQLAIRTGQYQTMNAAELYEGELVRYNRITGETEIDESKRKSDKVVAYVAYFRLVTGFEKYLLMTTEQVRAHAQRYSKSFSKPGTPWQDNFHAMALKTVMKLLLSKWGILSVELQKALEMDQAVALDPEGSKFEYPDNPENAIDVPNDAIEPADTQSEGAAA